jgi:hypothetical protein
MTDKPIDKNFIAFFTLGDMRLLNIKVPAHLADNPDEFVLGLPRDAGLNLAQSVLGLWQVSPKEGEAFLTGITDDVLSDVLIIHQLLEVLFPKNESDKYMQASNDHYGGRTPWQAIQDGESLDLRKYIEHMVYNGGW